MTETKYPRIHLVIDNCFAIKRWVRPSEWARVLRDKIGNINRVQSSTDLEIDPQFCPPGYTHRWIEEVRKCEHEYDFRMVSFYSGYVTYRSASLLNWDKSYRERFRDNYIFKTIDLASKFKATAGGALQAFPEELLQDPEKYIKAEALLMDYSIQCANYAAKKNILYAFEQMYTPTQGWWRIEDVKRYITEVYKSCGNPLYTTIDTAHMAGQSLFRVPTDEQFASMIDAQSAKGSHLPDEMLSMVEKGTTLNELKKAAEKYSYWFSEVGDEDLYKWLEEVSCYSPIMHLQQTDGTYSAHRPFVKKYNDSGIVEPRKLLESVVKCYDKEKPADMPPKVKDIYLAFEIFFGVTDSASDIISAMKESVQFWREVIREDGKPADYWL